MGKMTKADIIEAVYEKVGGFSKKEAAEIVETVFNTIKETLEREEITISARRVLTFKPSAVLKAALNGDEEALAQATSASSSLV